MQGADRVPENGWEAHPDAVATGEGSPNEIYTLLEESLMKLVLAGMENQRLSNQLHRSRQETHSLSIQLRNQQQSGVYQPSIESLRREIDIKDQKVAQLESQVRTLTSERGDTHGLKSQIEHLNTALLQANHQVQQLQEHLGQLTQQHASSAANLQRVVQENNSLGNMLEEYKEMNKLLKQELESPQRVSITPPTPTKIELQQQTPEPQAQTPNPQQPKPADDNERLAEQHKQWLSEKEGLLSDLSQLTHKSHELELQIGARDAHIEFLEKTHKELNQQLVNAQTEQAASKSMIVQLQSSLENYKQLSLNQPQEGAKVAQETQLASPPMMTQVQTKEIMVVPSSPRAQVLPSNTRYFEVIEDLKRKLLEVAGERDAFKDRSVLLQIENDKLRTDAVAAFSKDPHLRLMTPANLNSYRLVIEELAAKLAEKEAELCARDKEIAKILETIDSSILTHKRKPDHLPIAENPRERIYWLEKVLLGVKENETKLLSVMEDNHQLQSCLGELEHGYKSLQLQLSQSEQENRNLKAVHAASTLQEQDYLTFRHKVEQLTTQLQEREAELERLRGESSSYAAFREETQRLVAQNQSLSQDLNNLQERFALAETRLAKQQELEQQLKELVRELESARSLNTALEAQVASLGLLQQKVTELERSFEVQKNENEILVKKDERWKSIVEDLRGKLSAADVIIQQKSLSESRLKALEDENRKTAHELIAHKGSAGEMEILRAQLDSYKKMHSEVLSELTLSKTTLDEYATLLEHYRHREGKPLDENLKIAALENTQRVLMDKIAQKENIIEQLRSANMKHPGQPVHLTVAADGQDPHLLGRINQLETEISRLLAEKSAILAEKEALQTKVKDLTLLCNDPKQSYVATLRPAHTIESSMITATRRVTPPLERGSAATQDAALRQSSLGLRLVELEREALAKKEQINSLVMQMNTIEQSGLQERPQPTNQILDTSTIARLAAQHADQQRTVKLLASQLTEAEAARDSVQLEIDKTVKYPPPGASVQQPEPLADLQQQQQDQHPQTQTQQQQPQQAEQAARFAPSRLPAPSRGMGLLSSSAVGRDERSQP